MKALDQQEVELLEVLREILLVTRVDQNSGIRQVFWVKAVGTNDAECAILALARSFPCAKPRDTVAITTAEIHHLEVLRFRIRELIASGYWLLWSPTLSLDIPVWALAPCVHEKLP